ncbi:hypothetical protein, partial [Paraburkholderia sp. Tr-20389]|uniref:hypothetical protein n=1 Tax=Paraburkholderia sp. Tr-20389 TaxID=2703903 RepID=UPI00197D0A8A
MGILRYDATVAAAMRNGVRSLARSARRLPLRATVAALTALVAFFGASQDIVIDAYRRELLHDTE